MTRTSAVDIEFTKALPKAELHTHLSGSISRETLHDIWRSKQLNNECLDLEDPLLSIKTGADGFVDIVSFFPLFDKYIYHLCNDVETVKYITKRVIRDFESDGVRYLELRTTPRKCKSTGVGMEEYVAAVNEGVRFWHRPNFVERIEVYLIFSIDRKMTTEQGMEVVDLAIQYQFRSNNQGCYVVGIDLCGNPTKGDVSVFTPAFEKAKKHNLGITAHFAEVTQYSTDAELNTILSWKPDRLGHCINVPSELKDVICSQSLGLELCLSCNVLAGLTTGGFENHHLKEWITRDCPVALSTDDVGIFGSPLSNEYLLVAEHFHLSKDEVVELSKQAAAVAFQGRERMEGLIDEFANNM